MRRQTGDGILKLDFSKRILDESAAELVGLAEERELVVTGMSSTIWCYSEQQQKRNSSNLHLISGRDMFTHFIGNKKTLDLRGSLSVCAVVMSLGLCTAAAAQTCFTSDDMDAATRTALQSAGSRYFDMVSRGDTASVKQNSIPEVANNFGGIENTIKANQAGLAGAHATVQPPFMLKAEGTAPLPKAEFLCGVFDAQGQTKNSAEFVIPNLPPGSYGIVILDATGSAATYSIAFVLQQQASDWKIGNLFLHPSAIDGHDANWFITQARADKAKGQTHTAWFYYLEARDLSMPVPFMYTQASDKLYDEMQTVKPTDLPAGGNTPDLVAPGGKTYKLTEAFPLVVGKDLDVVVKYQNPDVSNTGQTFQENMNVMRALLTKFPELRDAFAGVVVRAVEPSGKDYGSMMPMKDIK